MKRSTQCEDRTHDLHYTSNCETYALSIAPTKHQLENMVINIYLNIFQIFFFAHESTKPKNYISLLIRVPRCFFPKENTRQTLRHILALTIYIYIQEVCKSIFAWNSAQYVEAEQNKYYERKKGRNYGNNNYNNYNY